ncbi:hypothetical protein H9P43_001479 [Blastocladiella emersonii ATCC 22665]|nr:hypothetical protein H9P43_001479 [Blastocladiella emersonii ATCC 22665]
MASTVKRASKAGGALNSSGNGGGGTGPPAAPSAGMAAATAAALAADASRNGGGGSARLGARRKSMLSPVRNAPNSGSMRGIAGSRNALANGTVGERALATTLESTSKALALYKERLSNLIQTNADLQQQCTEQEKDAIEVMGALRDQMERKDREIIALRSSIDQNQLQTEREKQEIHNSYARKLDELNGIILDKESAIRLMEQEVAAVKDFKKKRAELLKEIESQKTQMAEMERRFKESMVRMERKFFEEKVRMQKETNRRISELAAKAHQEAVATLDETTKDMYRENVRLVEALKSHMAATEDLTKQNAKLATHNTQLVQEKEMNDLIVRDKIIAAKNQNQIIREMEAKVVTLEQTLSHVVREFEVEREILRKKAHQELDDIKRVAAQLKLNLDRKAQEMRHIKRLAAHILKQRTDVERFFMDALDHVRREIAREHAGERKRRIDHYTRLARRAASLGNQPVPRTPTPRTSHAVHLDGVSPAPGAASPEPISATTVSEHGGGESRADSASPSPAPAKSDDPLPSVADAAKIDIADLAWTDKERILRVLFARMNGLIKDDDPTATAKQQREESLRKEFGSSSSNGFRDDGGEGGGFGRGGWGRGGRDRFGDPDTGFDTADGGGGDGGLGMYPLSNDGRSESIGMSGFDAFPKGGLGDIDSASRPGAAAGDSRPELADGRQGSLPLTAPSPPPAATGSLPVPSIPILQLPDDAPPLSPVETDAPPPVFVITSTPSSESLARDDGDGDGPPVVIVAPPNGDEL